MRRRALTLVFERLAKNIQQGQGIAAALPAYLSDEQIDLIGLLARKAKWPWLGRWPPRRRGPGGA